jgi:hypothetical protein
VLLVPNARRHFSWYVTHCCRRKLPTVKSVSNQPALWTPCIYTTVKNTDDKLKFAGVIVFVLWGNRRLKCWKV